MLLAVEGGGFFSSSASGYSKGLTLLLLGQNTEDNNHMKVSPWNQHYQLVDSDRQLASAKNRFSRGCATFVCFGRASAGVETSSPLKVGPAQQQQDVSPGGKGENEIKSDVGGDDERKVSIKSSLKKKPSNNKTASVITECEGLDERSSDNIPCHAETRKVQWTDVCGSELVEIREFEPSENDGSDDEFDSGNERSCSCTIM